MRQIEPDTFHRRSSSRPEQQHRLGTACSSYDGFVDGPEGGAEGLNTLVLGGNAYLLAEGKLVVHVVESTGGDDGRPAVWSQHLRAGNPQLAPSARLYDWQLLAEPCWRQRALCGRPWSTMTPSEAGAIFEHQEPAIVPSCKACMRVLDRLFPPIAPDDRIRVLAMRVSGAVIEHGEAQVYGAPGPQIEPLRRAIRVELRHAGVRPQSLVLNDTIHVLSSPDTPIDPEVAARQRRGVIDAVGEMLDGHSKPAIDRSERSFTWTAWGSSL